MLRINTIEHFSKLIERLLFINFFLLNIYLVVLRILNESAYRHPNRKDSARRTEENFRTKRAGSQCVHRLEMSQGSLFANRRPDRPSLPLFSFVGPRRVWFSLGQRCSLNIVSPLIALLIHMKIVVVAR